MEMLHKRAIGRGTVGLGSPARTPPAAGTRDGEARDWRGRAVAEMCAVSHAAAARSDDARRLRTAARNGWLAEGGAWVGEGVGG